LRSFIEEFSDNCRFILTANFSNRILDPIKSRCTVIDFSLSKGETQESVLQFNSRLKGIIEAEGITYEKKAVASVIIKYFPDYRKILNEVQRCGHSGELQINAMSSVTDDALKEVVGYVKAKKFGDLRRWVVENADIDFPMLVRGLYDSMMVYIQPQSIPDLVLLLNEYDYRRSFVADAEIHTVAMLTQIMGSIEFK
jgi:DNA polymerase III delta prime subunit